MRILKIKKSLVFRRGFLMVVGEEGFEPPTLWSQTRCATKLRYSPTIVLGLSQGNDKHYLNMGWLTGLEPATTGITIRDSTN
jgi:hypothetical protein